MTAFPTLNLLLTFETISDFLTLKAYVTREKEHTIKATTG